MKSFIGADQGPGSSTISFLDDPEHQRFQQVTAQGTILYFDGFGAHEELVMGSSWKWNDFLTVGNVMVGMRSMSGVTATTSYFHADHLGSISVITDQSGNVLERLSYDAWGKRRFANGADDPSGSITSQTTRGFTGQEELGVSGLVHLNGRIYDPLFGRMTSADPTVPDPLNAQAWNRYSYVGNDPLTFTDPTGFSWLSNFFHEISTFFRAIFANSLVRAIVQIAIAAILAPETFGIGTILAAAASAAIVTGLSGGKLIDIVKAAAIAGAMALAFYEVGNITGFHGVALSKINASNISNFAANIAGHAAVGCLSAVASGGKCEAGALSAGVGAASAPLVLEVSSGASDNITVQRLEGSAVSGVVGGLASLAGGGKFVDGAVTAAFGYLFNACGAKFGCTATGLAGGAGAGATAALGCDVATVGVCVLADPVIVAAGTAIGGAIGLIADTADAVRNWLSGVVYNTRAGDLPATGQAPNSTQVKDDGNGHGQIRDYDSNGNAVKDFDFGHDHTGAGDPHVHDWDWTQIPPRGPPRPLGPNE